MPPTIRLQSVSIPSRGPSLLATVVLGLIAVVVAVPLLLLLLAVVLVAGVVFWIGWTGRRLVNTVRTRLGPGDGRENVRVVRRD
ncbi:MAG: hypothetical protein HKO59_06285 [Phycisphaerales bacterium]|nr:hypothetical protein [Phycisphaerales bacterium]